MTRISEKWTHIVPVIIFLVAPAGIFITYGIAVANDHVAPFWPYISDTGTHPPESCIFGQVLNLAAFLFTFMVYIRWKQINEHVKIKPTIRIGPKTNKAAFIFGILSCIGVDVVANFQVTNVKIVHFLGAFVAFVPGTIYFIFQTIFTRKLKKSSRKLFYVRLTLTVITIIATFGYMVPSGFANKQFTGTDKQKWDVNDGGYSLHVLSSSMEWILVFSYFAYILTFYWDFRNLMISAPEVTLLNVSQHSSSNRL